VPIPIKMTRRFCDLAVSILMDINEEWITGRRYLRMDVE
jgi:hypothetical protein